MSKLRKSMATVMTVLLTGAIMVMPRLTCVFILHQPQMPDELNDFRCYE